MRAIPPPVMVPVASLLIGYSESMKLTVVVLSALWPILLNATSAVRQIDPLLLDVARIVPADGVAAHAADHSSGDRAVAAAWDPHRDPASHRGTLLVEMLTSLPGIRRADDQVAAQFSVQRGLRVAGAGGIVRLRSPTTCSRSLKA